MKTKKPLNRKAYGSIPHLLGSGLDHGDHHCAEGQSKICTEKPRDSKDIIIVQEKLDGSCCSVARINGDLVALNKDGYLATSSPYKQHHLFDAWVSINRQRFEFLREGWRVVG